MNEDKHNTVLLPASLCREDNPNFVTDATALAEVLQKTVVQWILSCPEKPFAESIGAGIYAALWGLSESANPQTRTAMRNACLATLLQNDDTTAKLLSVDNSLPPS